MSFLDHIRLGTTGLRAYQTQLDVIGNNIANAGTTGFKKSTVRFEESWNYATGNSIETEGGTSVLSPTTKGYGLGKTIVDIDSKQGQYQETGNPLDLAIQGDGYFVIEENGRQMFTRDGNFRINKDLVLVQEAAGSFVKGWVATLNPDGTSTVNTDGASSKMSFEFIQKIDAKPTTKMTYRSNLDSNAQGRTVQLDQSTYIIRDDNNNSLNVTAKWTQTDEDTWDFSVKQDGVNQFSTQVDINSFGDLSTFTTPTEDNLEIRRNAQNQITHVSWKYPSTNFDGIVEEKTMTVEFPSSVNYKGNTTEFSHVLRNASPDDADYLTSGSGAYQATFTKGDKHIATTEVVDSAGFPHSMATKFELVAPQKNQ